MGIHKYFKTILYIIILIVASSCDECIEGHGDIVSENFVLDEFENLYVSVPANVVIINGEQPSMKITTYESYMVAINKAVSGNRLNIDGNFCFAENEDIKIQLTIPNELGVIVVNGTANIHSKKPCKADELDIKINGSGNISLKLFTNRIFSNINGSGNLFLSGTCQKLSLGIAGSGNFNGDDLSAYKAKVTIAGSGNASLIAFNELNASVTGSGIINYSGNPDISINITGSGKVNKLD